MCDPQPPQRAVSPVGPRPYAIEPVPEMSRTPGPSPNASARAIEASGSTNTSSAIDRRDSSSSSARRSTGRPTPASPTTSTATVACSMSSPARAVATAAAIASALRSARPGTTAEGPPSADTRSRPSASATITWVFEPPPSTPITRPVTVGYPRAPFPELCVSVRRALRPRW